MKKKIVEMAIVALLSHGCSNQSIVDAGTDLVVGEDTGGGNDGAGGDNNYTDDDAVDGGNSAEGDPGLPVLVFKPVQLVYNNGRTSPCPPNDGLTVVGRLYSGGLLLEERQLHCENDEILWGPVSPGDYEVGIWARYENTLAVFMIGWPCEPCGYIVPCDAPIDAVYCYPDCSCDAYSENPFCRSYCFTVQGSRRTEIVLRLPCNEVQSPPGDACGI